MLKEAPHIANQGDLLVRQLQRRAHARSDRVAARGRSPRAGRDTTLTAVTSHSMGATETSNTGSNGSQQLGCRGSAAAITSLGRSAGGQSLTSDQKWRPFLRRQAVLAGTRIKKGATSNGTAVAG